MTEAAENFLKNAGWDRAQRSAIAGDLSTRQYLRLKRTDQTAILLQCDPAIDASLPAFLRTTQWIRSNNLSAPEIYAADQDSGLALLEDFGDAKLTHLIRADPACQRPHYETILETLIRLRQAEPMDVARPTAVDFCEATKLADDWYPGAAPGELNAFRAGLVTILGDVLTATPTTSLRDFHADNIIWLPKRTRPKRAGLLDYQDAILTHPAYDLMSLLTDARTDVSPSLRDDILHAYARQTGDGIESLKTAVSVLGAQRSLRILGIFARAARRDGKTQHLPALPRVYAYLMDSARHPMLAPFADALRAGLPAPDTALIKGLAK